MFSKLIQKYKDSAGRLDVRLTTYYTIILVTLSVLVCLFCFIRLQHLLLKQVDKILIDEAHELTDDIAASSDYRAGCARFEQDINRRKYYQIEFRLLTTDLQTLYATPYASRLPLPDLGVSRSFETVRLEGKRTRYRVYQRTFSPGSQDMVVQIATTMRTNQELLERFYENVLWALPLIFVVSIGCGMLAARKPCRIIRNIAAVTATITSESLHERLPVPSARDDVRALTETINGMIERLEASFAQMRQFTADVSHELRTPLFAVRGNMEVALSRQRDAAEYREVLSECLEKIDFLIKMVNDMFLISRFEAGKINLDAQVVNLASILQDICDFYTPMAQDRSIDLQLEACETAVTLADRGRVLQLLSNLLDNALKFTPQGGRVTLSLVRQQAAIILEVTDTGIGIPEHELQRVFDRFYQSDRSRSSPQRGAGLGLQICKRIAEAHGWTIGVRPNAGQGVTFFVTIPVKQ